MLEVQKIRHSFEGSMPVLDGVSLSISGNEIIALLGPSGCGKSTLLRLIANLIDRQEGTYSELTSEDIAFVFQDAALMPWSTIAQNVALPLKIRGKHDPDAVKKALADFEISDLADRYPANVSGGQRMRASLARAMVTKPKFLLLDEPFGALDEILRFKMNELLLELRATSDLATLFVTHSIYEAVYLADRILVMQNGKIKGGVAPGLDRTMTANKQRSSAAYMIATAQVAALLVEESTA